MTPGAEDDGHKIGLVHTKDEDVSDAGVLDMVRRAVDALGGMDRFVRRGDTVLIKPNQTVWFPAHDGITTDPRVVAALVTLAKEAGAGHVVVGDGSGGDLKSANTLEVTGVKRLALDAGADEVVGLEDVEQTEIEIEVDGESRTVAVPEIAMDAQCVINVPKAKTHFEDLITCAMKNWVGIISQDTRPRVMQDPLLAKLTARVHERVPAHLTVVDGLWAGEGNGPAANTPTWLGCIVAGTNPIAVDATVARLMGFDPQGLVFAGEGEAIGLGARDASRITIEGPAVEDVRIAAKPTAKGFDHLPIRVLQGEGVTFAGSLGHLKSICDVLHKYDMWPKIEDAFGKPTFMVGRVHDPDFDKHVKEGPYFVIDDVAYDTYRTDRRVTFIPGHPATHNIFPYIFRTLHVPTLGPKAMQLEKAWKKLDAYFHFRSWNEAPRTEREREA